MRTVKIAFRNIFRNTRRSIMTILAIGVSAVSIILFGGFVFSILYGLQTSIVKNTGHLHVYQKGFFDYGSGNPSAYSIADYEGVIKTIKQDAVLKDRVLVATPILKVYGIAGNFTAETSKTFFGIGVIPSDRETMMKWNQYGLKSTRSQELGLFNEDLEGGVVGYGMARMLGLCYALNVPDCAPQPVASASKDAPPEEDFTELVKYDVGSRPEPEDKRPKIDLLAATAAGAPNVVALFVNKAENQTVKEMDDVFVAMHLSKAQRLLYGKGEKKATGIVLQLEHTQDIPLVSGRLRQIFAEKNLELQDFKKLSPNYKQIISMFNSIFSFLSIVMGVIVLFTIVNTMSMSVMERVNEIGTLRALGVRRGGILRQFLVEGCLLGAIGASIGCLIGTLVALAINSSGMTWMPPNNAEPVFLTIQAFQNPVFIPMVWLLLIVLSTISSLIPARKAAHMTIVDALGHV